MENQDNLIDAHEYSVIDIQESVQIRQPNGFFTLHGNGTWTWTSTKGNNRSSFLSLSWTSVNISVQYIRTR